MTTLKITRPQKKWQDKLRAYEIFIDGNRVGAITQGDEVSVPVTPGQHKLQLKIDWCCSPVVEVDLTDGSTFEISCGPNSKPWLALAYTTFWREKYIWVRASQSDA